MSEIFNLNNLCRCCHADGQFKRLDVPYEFGNGSEIYANLIHDVFGLYIRVPPSEYSHNICDGCILELRSAAQFKMQILDCEQKFTEYCRNEQFINITTDHIKVEEDTGFDNELPEYNCNIKEENYQVKVEVKREVKKTNNKKLNKRQDNTLNKDNRIAKTKKEVGIEETERHKKKKRLCGVERVQESLMLHVKGEHGGYIYFCKGCRQKFTSETDLKTHVTNTHTDNVLKCVDCDKTFKFVFDFDKHTNTHLKMNSFCLYCDKTFTTVAERKNHESDIHNIEYKVYICDLCNREFPYKATLIKHLLWHKGIKKYICETCGLRFFDSANLRIHIMSVHEKIKRFNCDLCDKKFSVKKMLKIHLLKHKGIKPFHCNLCPKTFNYKLSLDLHLESHNDKNISNDKFKCPHCAKIFNSTRSGRRHVKTKHRLTSAQHLCQICNKYFFGKYSYNRHMYKMHTPGVDKTPFPCDLCKKRFTTKGTMLRHKEKCGSLDVKVKVPCELCKQKVVNLESHMRNHNVRPFSCSYCGKTFPARNSLNRHVRGHENILTFDCDLCPKKYKLKEGLRRHKLKSHGVNSGVEPKIEDSYELGNWASNVENLVR